jgi:hypothetical protein
MLHREEINPQEVGTVSPRERVDEIIRLIDEVLGSQPNAAAGSFGAGPATTSSAGSRAGVRAHGGR